MEPDLLLKRVRRARRGARTSREAPYVIYPEILVIVDYDGYRLHGGDNVQIKRYFVSFWNGVDLRYKLLKGPKIRISIAGIIISRMTVFVLNYFALMLARDTVWPIDQLQKVLLVEMGRSPWDGRGWGSSSTYAPDVSRSTTPNTQRPTNYYNTYSTTTENPYYQFNRPTQNPNAPNQSPGNIFDKEGRQRTSVTTIKNPYSVDISPLRPSTTKNPYDFSNLHQFRKQSSNRNPTSQNPYQQQSVNTYRPNPYQPYNAYHASNNEPISIYGNASNVTTNSNVASNTTIVTESVAGTECEDKVTDIAGSMTCREFLSHYGFQYCSYRYMQQNCCKSQKEVCEGRNWRKRK
ncbi:Uncharacterized protein GBIM_06092 [Gryllus bimaculatus]|nr:Uncharacterized protein GBIM_06092 [Gryllus bimaculatus]